MNKILDFFEYIGNKKFVVIFITCYIISFILLTSTFKYTDKDNILDLKFSYSSEEIYRVFDAIGEPGRSYYIKGALIDYVYMIFYSLTLISVISFLLKNTGIRSNIKKYILFIPLLILFFDFFENLFILVMLKAYPERIYPLDVITPYFTTLKWISFFSVILVLFLLLFYRFYQRSLP